MQLRAKLFVSPSVSSALCAIKVAAQTRFVNMHGLTSCKYIGLCQNVRTCAVFPPWSFGIISDRSPIKTSTLGLQRVPVGREVRPAYWTNNKGLRTSHLRISSSLLLYILCKFSQSILQFKADSICISMSHLLVIMFLLPGWWHHLFILQSAALILRSCFTFLNGDDRLTSLLLYIMSIWLREQRLCKISFI